MNVVRHQAIGVNIYNLSVVTSLYNMMWIMWKYYTCHPWHGGTLIALVRKSLYQLRE